jgi:hypothetical protein
MPAVPRGQLWHTGQPKTQLANAYRPTPTTPITRSIAIVAMRISQRSYTACSANAIDCWGEACAVLDEQAAAVCVVLIDQAMHREDNPVRQPNGYFRSMLRKAERGELHLHKSVFGILKRVQGTERCVSAELPASSASACGMKNLLHE